MARLKPPKLPDEPPKVPSEAEVKRLLKICAGTTYTDRRDTAIIRMLIDTGMRAGELAGLRLDEVDLARGVVLIHGKGGKVRMCPLGRKACRDLDRYIRARRKHRDAEMPNLWLGHNGPLTANGIFQTVRKRCRQAGVEGIHPHSFRHRFASTWLAEGATGRRCWIHGTSAPMKLVGTNGCHRASAEKSKPAQLATNRYHRK